MQEQLQGDQLLVRMPHYQLRGQDLYWLGSGNLIGDSPRRRSPSGTCCTSRSMAEMRRTFANSADAVVSGLLDSKLCELLEPSFPGNRRRIIVIEPHADDAALSVGGTMWAQRLECEFLIATMASRGNHTRYPDLGYEFFDIDKVTKIRRLESELFAQLVGGTAISVGLTDSELRYRDTNWNIDFFTRHRMSIRVAASRIAGGRERQRWTEAVRKLLAEHQSSEIWFPLGAPHGDHLLTADACYSVFLQNPALIAGRILRTYGEFPYMTRYWPQMRSL